MAYSSEEIETIFNTICDRIIEGESTRTILMEENMPSSRTFWKWLDESEEKVKQYARAKELYSESTFEDIILISDGTDDDLLIDENGLTQVNHNVIQRDRLRVDSRKWALSKLNPKKYGDSQLLKLGDQDGNELKINAIFQTDLLNVPAHDSTTEDSKS